MSCGPHLFADYVMLYRVAPPLVFGNAAAPGPTMRILEDTPSHLALRDRTLWLSAILIGAAVLLAVGVVRDREPRLLIPAGLFVIFALAFLRATDVTFDKIARTCVIRRLDVLRLTRIQLGFDDIMDARIETEPMPDAPAAPSCRLSLVTQSAVMPLTASYEPSRERYDAMREAVLDAIFNDGPRRAAADPIQLLVKEGRIIDAVSMLRVREGIDLKTARERVKALQNAPDL
jgi:hypothetical protein